MDSNELYKKLILAARSHPPADAVPYAFEKRIMSRVFSLAKIDPWAIWSRNLWRAAFLCGLVCLAVGVWSYGKLSREPSTESLSVAFESTVFSPVDEGAGDAW